MSDKRSVSTDALETLGTAPIPDGSGRDAIHLAVEPVIASERLLAGQDIYLLPDGKAAKAKDGNGVGIVDPFLKQSVKAGERFWLVVYPRQITSLRHVWSHPAFEEPISPVISEEDKWKARVVAERLTKTSEQWLREFLRTSKSPSYEVIIEAIKNGGSVELDEEGNYSSGVEINPDSILSIGRDAYGDIPSEFWDHVENVTGQKQTLRPTHFSCSC